MNKFFVIIVYMRYKGEGIMVKQTIGIDMDEVLVDTIKKLLMRYNQETFQTFAEE